MLMTLFWTHFLIQVKTELWSFSKQRKSLQHITKPITWKSGAVAFIQLLLVLENKKYVYELTCWTCGLWANADPELHFQSRQRGMRVDFCRVKTMIAVILTRLCDWRGAERRKRGEERRKKIKLHFCKIMQTACMVSSPSNLRTCHGSRMHRLPYWNQVSHFNPASQRESLVFLFKKIREILPNSSFCAGRNPHAFPNGLLAPCIENRKLLVSSPGTLPITSQELKVFHATFVLNGTCYRMLL
jgi:hypothetical protein